jgi:hypothetical protein
VSSLASQESTVIGGIGMGDRAFPCSHPGLTYATWICIVKTGAVGDEADNNFVCLSLALSSRDKALIVSTQESKEESGVFCRAPNLRLILLFQPSSASLATGNLILLAITVPAFGSQI